MLFDEVMVPPGVREVVICPSDAPHVTVSDPGRVRELVEALNRLPTRPSDLSCTGIPTSPYRAFFRYPSGPSVLVRVIPGCVPPIDNGSLQVTPTEDAGDVVRLLGGLAGSR